MLINSLSVSDKSGFCDKFLQAYISPCFGSLSKKEIDLLVFRLLIKTGAIDLSNDQQSISRQLSIPISKVKSMIYDIHLRDENCDAVWFRQEALKALQHTRFCSIGRKIEIQLCIENPLLRKELEATIKELNGFADYSFNSEILRIDFDVYALLLKRIIDDPAVCARLEAAIKTALKMSNDESISWKELMNAFLMGAAGRAGEEVVDLSFGYFTGGASQLLKIAKGLLD
jgi:hypothetical protein